MQWLARGKVAGKHQRTTSGIHASGWSNRRAPFLFFFRPPLIVLGVGGFPLHTIDSNATFPSQYLLPLHTNMVFYFKSRCGQYTIYMGRDKYENEDLIRYGLDLDVWFHVDDLSSAHVYLRMKPGMTLEDIPDDVLLDCSSLVKDNSIQGCKVCSIITVLSSATSFNIHTIVETRNHRFMSYIHVGKT
jgi:hypothetical protein